MKQSGKIPGPKEWMIVSLMLLFLLSVSPVIAQPQDFTDTAKIFRITAAFTASSVTPDAVVLEYGYGPSLQPAPGIYTGRIIASDGGMLGEFAISDPRIWRGDEAVADRNGRLVNFSGMSEEKDRATTGIIFPFNAAAARFRIIDSGSGKIRAETDLLPAVTAFCRAHPGDPDCRSRNTGGTGTLPVLGFAGAGVCAVAALIILHAKRLL